jgi:uncharacterized membrane protein YfcA
MIGLDIEPGLRRPVVAVAGGAAVGILGGLIGLGGAEFRLPLLIFVFALGPHQAVRINLLITLITVTVATLARFGFAAFADLPALTVTILAMIAGGMATAWLGARSLSALSTRRLVVIIAIVLFVIAMLLAAEALIPALGDHHLPPDPMLQAPAGFVAGLVIGGVSSLLGVAGGELIIPTMMFVFGADVRTAGTASLLISLPLVAIGVIGHVRAGAYRSRETLTHLVLPMGIGSAMGATAGGALLPYVSSPMLKLVLATILALSAIKLWRQH